MAVKVVHLIAAARPNFMKVAPLYHALTAEVWCDPRIVHTGQHYDANMFDAFFRDLRLPAPHASLGIGSGSHAEQTGGVMIAYEKLIEDERPDAIVVVGDVNSTLACALVGAKQHVPVVHLEAGLRSGDRRMPEEINRLATDAVADLLWPPSQDGVENLLREGVPSTRIENVGNIMLDSFEMLREAIDASATRAGLGLRDQRYAVVTLHRPSNVDDTRTLQSIVRQLVDAAGLLHLVFAVHPRTRRKLQEFGLLEQLRSTPHVHLLEPLGYVEFMSLVCGASAAVTDSGGLQEETTYLGIPCLTLRENTERPITLTEGTNRLVAVDSLFSSLRDALAGRWPTGRLPPLWDGRTAGRCVNALQRFLSA